MMPCQDIMPAFSSTAVRRSTTVVQPPNSETMTKIAPTLANVNSRNISVSVRMTPREPAYIVNAV